MARAPVQCSLRAATISAFPSPLQPLDLRQSLSLSECRLRYEVGQARGHPIGHIKSILRLSVLDSKSPSRRGLLYGITLFEHVPKGRNEEAPNKKSTLQSLHPFD